MISPRDYLRLEVEAAPSGLVNLVQNPNGDLGGWGWLSPVANTFVRTATGPSPDTALEFRTFGGTSNYFTTEPLPMAAGQYVAASYLYEASGGGLVDAPFHRVRFEFLTSDKTLISSSAQGPYVSSASPGAYQAAAVAAPALTAFVRLRYDVYATNAGANPATGQYVRYRHVTVATAATAAALGSEYRNLLKNPRYGVDLTGWTGGSGSGTPGTAATLAREPDGAWGYRMRITRTAAGTGHAQALSEDVPVTAGVSYTAVVGQNPGDPEQVAIQWRTAAGALVSESLAFGVAGAPTISLGAVAPAGATKARLSIQPAYGPTGVSDTVGDVWFGTTTDASNGPGAPAPRWHGGTADTTEWAYAWAGTPDASESIASVPGVGLSYITPRTYFDVLDSALDVSVNRQPLDVGILQGTVTDTALDPAVADAIRPGRRVRLLALTPTGAWEDLYNGRLDKAKVSYSFKRPDDQRTKVTLSGLDSNSLLANVKAPQGVATIADLPYVLEGAGVPWDVDGSGNQVPSAQVVSSNSNASVLDQVAITRDSALGYAWTDRLGILKARSDREAAYYTGEPHTLDESDYTDLQVAFDTSSIINTVSVVLHRFNSATGETEEVPYGPYIDAASVREWGPRDPGPFTVQGVSDVGAWAAAVLAQNAQPQVTVSSVTLPIRDAADVVAGKALLDLYSQVRVLNAAKNIDQVLRVTGVTHRVTARRWHMDLTFEAVGAVAAPTAAPGVAGDSVQDGVWTPLALLNGWVATGGSDALPRYMRKNGLVHVQGVVKSGVLNQPAAYLPAGCRPAGNLPLGTIAAGVFARLGIYSSGAVTPVSGSNTWFSLSAPPFPADQ